VAPRSSAAIRRNMQAVRSRDNRMETALRLALWKRGHRYSRYARLPGRPDLAFKAQHVAVFVDGDFWHARVLRERGIEALGAEFKTPRKDWWLRKLSANADRDDRVTSVLRQDGWTVVRLWERDIRKDLAGAVARVCECLHSSPCPDLDRRTSSDSSRPTRESRLANS
jgi:DNA mismatch endonuclease (patch repair protein)